ncbi:MAG: HEAT repeat domain-containing protein [Gemmataceae bacterium]|nr:HEAT repeat domain-containing protein [Gemmataceae bacterium]
MLSATNVFLSMGEPTVPHIPVLLNHADAGVRSQGTVMVPKMWPKSRKCLSPLIDVFKNDKDQSVRRAAANACVDLGGSLQGILPALSNALEDMNADVRGTAIGDLGRIGPSAKVAIPRLLKLRREEEDPNCRRVLPRTSISPSDEKIVTALMEALRDRKTPERTSVAAALRNLGPSAKAAVMRTCYPVMGRSGVRPGGA